MKPYKIMLIAATILCDAFTACTDTWDEHYGKHYSFTPTAGNLTVVDQPAADYLAQSTDYSSMYQLFDKTGVFERMDKENKRYTLFVVKNDAYKDPDGRATDSEEVSSNSDFQSKGNVTDVPVAPASLKDGMRLLMWNGNFADVLITPMLEGGTTLTTIAGNRINKVIQTTDGYIYELDHMIETPRTLLQIIEDLPDEYSMFRDTMLAKTQNVFDRAASTPIGVDNSGNTIYDSVFSRRNAYFERYAKLDITDNAAKITMFIPSNTLIENAIAEGKAKLRAWQQERPDSTLTNWATFQAMFFNQVYQPEDFALLETPDITSAFGKQWRTTVNKVDLSNPIKMTNGVAYYVTDLKLPTRDVLIWRYKQYFSKYKHLSEVDRDAHFVLDNITVHWAISKKDYEVKVGMGWPDIVYEGMRFGPTDKEAESNSVTYTPFEIDVNDDGSYKIRDIIVPSGEYEFYFGFSDSWRKNSKTSKLQFFINDEMVYEETLLSEIKKLTRDRGNGYFPEGFDPDTPGLSDKPNAYDRDGPFIAKVNIQNDELKPITITVRAFTPCPEMSIAHWVLRPTIDNY